jgi:hypothetical protein
MKRQNKESDYILQEATKSRCGNCGNTVALLVHHDGSRRRPSFYICWPCFAVFEIGRGPVPRQVT